MSERRSKGGGLGVDDITDGTVKTLVAAEGSDGMDGEAAGPGGQRSGRVRRK